MNEVMQKKLEGYDLEYEVSSDGRVRVPEHTVQFVCFGKGIATRNYKAREIKPVIAGATKKARESGRIAYPAVNLAKDGKQVQRYIHRLVAEEFIPNTMDLPMVNHIDENPNNNCIDNLEQCTNYYNMMYSKGERYIPVWAENSKQENK